VGFQKEKENEKEQHPRWLFLEDEKTEIDTTVEHATSESYIRSDGCNY